MALRRRSGSSWVTPNRIQRRSGSSWVNVDRIYRRSGSSWIMVYQSYIGMSGKIERATSTYTDYNNPRPAPSMTVYAYPAASVSGGTGSYTYQWSVTSGVAVISGSTTGQTCTIYAEVRNHTYITGNLRCVVSDGVTSITLNAAYTLGYEGGTPV